MSFDPPRTIAAKLPSASTCGDTIRRLRAFARLTGNLQREIAA